MSTTKASIKQAMAWIVEEVERRLSDDAALGPLVEKLVHKAVHGVRCTNQPYDLAAYETFADFLEEPTGNMGWAAETWEDVIIPDVMEIISEAVRSVTRQGLESGPDPVRKTLQAWMHDVAKDDFDMFLSDYIFEEADGFSEFEHQLMERLARLPFRETLLAKCPDVRKRLEQDVARAERFANARKQAVTLAPQIRQAVQKRFPERISGPYVSARLLTTILRHVTNLAGIAALEILRTDKQLSKLCSKKKWRDFRKMTAEWLEMVTEARQLDFKNPMVRLFHLLSDLQDRDGRDWYVTVSADNQTSFYTFSCDNWPYLLAFALTEAAGCDLDVIVRRFEKLADPEANLPLKTVSGFAVVRNKVIPMTANEVREASTIDYKTGQRIPPEKTVRYVGLADLLPEFLKRPCPTFSLGK